MSDSSSAAPAPRRSCQASYSTRCACYAACGNEQCWRGGHHCLARQAAAGTFSSDSVGFTVNEQPHPLGQPADGRCQWRHRRADRRLGLHRAALELHDAHVVDALHVRPRMSPIANLALRHTSLHDHMGEESEEGQLVGVAINGLVTSTDDTVRFKFRAAQARARRGLLSLGLPHRRALRRAADQPGRHVRRRTVLDGARTRHGRGAAGYVKEAPLCFWSIRPHSPST